MKQNSEFEVTSEGTLLPFLIECFSGKSRNYVKGILKRGQVTVDGKSCTDFARALTPGQKVEVLKTAPIDYNLGFPIIYEDEELIVIDKPAGMLAIASDNEREKTAYHIVNDYMKSKTKPGRVFVVHRLDRDTSGVMVLAKSEMLKHSLQENWNEAVIRRGYIAVVEGKIRANNRTIKSWLKQTKEFLVYSSHTDGDGKLAITNIKTLKATDKYSLLEVSIETGRKNQIRVHMSDIGHPVAGDKRYGAMSDPIDRLALHASILSIKHPFTAKIMRFESKTPSTFQKVFK